MSGADLSGINTTGVQANVAFDPLPSGWQNVQITASEQKPTNDATGSYLKLELTVLDGPFAGRKLFDQINLWNANPTAVEIAYKTMKSIYNALGVPGVMSSDELHGKPLMVKVKLKPAETKRDAAGNILKQYDAGNEVKGYDTFGTPHEMGHTEIAGGVAGAPQGTPAWAAAGGAAPGAPAPTAAPAAAAWTPPAGVAQPWAATAAPAAPGAPAAPSAPPAPVAFPPQGWTAHPDAPGYFYQGQEVLTEADLRARMAPAVPSAPTAPPAPAAGGLTPSAAPGVTPPWAR